MRKLARAAAVTATVTGVLGATALVSPAQAAPSDGSEYAALGDSYSAASGVLPLDPTAHLLCARSTKNYPNVIAQATGAHLTDATCGGATTEHFANSQYAGVAPQLDAVSENTELVTLTIGGNDNGTFLDAVLACGLAGAGSLGKGSPCKDKNGSSFEDDVRNKTYPAVKAALAAVHEKAPDAEVAVLGYPWIMPAAFDKSCFAKMPIAEGDVPYLRSLQSTLNGVVKQASDETGSTFVDLAEKSEGHDSCSGDRWVEPALFGTNFVPVHPNAEGEKQMADITMDALGLR
ncbi:Lipase 2 precursor [Streptomyces sp. YIM 130001]|uniref:SGNH/GDSL hydrolase family protein n=1 Tax=Streptomyces sp. YIM 130001 TaxID=2259644 RepID=UPI000E6594F0|nr:SGNH/GDSL hydrolase family protein [Streptomyces sp. YIM 130001]RII09144.1 Lipase 2 precursor [Streptomyces sp. YIM 130001]